MITYTILCGYTPFRSEDRAELTEEVVKADVQFHKSYWKGISHEGREKCREKI